MEDEIKKKKKKTKTTIKEIDTRPPIAEFRTSEIQLATYLRYIGITVQAVIKVSDYRAEFLFHNVDRSTLDDFNADKATVEPKMYASIMRQQTQAARRVTSQ